MGAHQALPAAIRLGYEQLTNNEQLTDGPEQLRAAPTGPCVNVRSELQVVPLVTMGIGMSGVGHQEDCLEIPLSWFIQQRDVKKDHLNAVAVNV